MKVCSYLASSFLSFSSCCILFSNFSIVIYWHLLIFFYMSKFYSILFFSFASKSVSFFSFISIFCSSISLILSFRDSIVILCRSISDFRSTISLVLWESCEVSSWIIFYFWTISSLKQLFGTAYISSCSSIFLVRKSICSIYCERRSLLVFLILFNSSFCLIIRDSYSWSFRSMLA